MPSVPVIYADFHNADAQGRVRLNSIGTVSDLSRQQVQLREHLAVQLYSDDADEQGRERRLSAQGTVTYSAEEQCWMAIIDWQKIESKPPFDSPPGVSEGTVPKPGSSDAALASPQRSPSAVVNR
jgi:hypothetical protein